LETRERQPPPINIGGATSIFITAKTQAHCCVWWLRARFFIVIFMASLAIIFCSRPRLARLFKPDELAHSAGFKMKNAPWG
jgi:hypothetical protein